MQRHFSASLPRTHDAFGIYPTCEDSPTNETARKIRKVPSAPERRSTAGKSSSGNEALAEPSILQHQRCPAPPPRSNATSASARHSSACGSRPGTSRQKQLCDVMLELVKGGRALHQHASRPSTSRTVASVGHPPVALTPIAGEAMHSIKTAARDKMSSWPLMVDDAASSDDTASRPPTGGSARTSPRVTAHQPFCGPLQKELKQQVDAMVRLHHATCRGKAQGTDCVPMNGAEVLSTCAAMLEVLRRGTSHADRPCDEDATPREDLQHGHRLPSLATMTTIHRSPLPRMLEEFLTSTLPNTATGQWKTFEEKTLPAHVDEDYRSVLDDTLRKLHQVDAATADRLQVELAAMQAAEVEWNTCRESHTAEFREMEALAAENEGTLDALDRRFQILFERHAQEHVLSQEAKRRIELVELLHRNEKLLRSEVRALSTHLDNVRTRKESLVQSKQAELQRAVDVEAETKEEVRCLLSEKQWLTERHQSISLRFAEEQRRTAEIHEEIAHIKAKMSRDRNVPIGPELTPRPQWLDRMDTIVACRLPTPKQPPPTHQEVALDLDEDEVELPLSSPRGDEEGGPPVGYTRQRDRRHDTLIMLGIDAPARSTSVATPSAAARKRSGGMSLMGGLRVGSLFATPLDALSAGRGMKQGHVRTRVPNDAASFREFVLRMRERLAVQSEMVRLAQDLAQQFRRAHQTQLDTAANVCSLSVATAGGGLSKQAPVAVAPIGPAGASVPAPNWPRHELAQRCLALWAAVLQEVHAKGDHRLVHPEQTSVPALLALLHRHGRGASQGRLPLGGTNRSSAMATRASTAVPEPSPFPYRAHQRSSTDSTSHSSTTPQPHNVSLHHASVGSAASLMAAGLPDGAAEEPYGKAVYGEIELSQLHYVLGRQSEAYAAAIAPYEPSAAAADGGGAAAASSPHGARRMSVAATTTRNRRRNDGGGSRTLGDAVRTIQSLGVDPDTGERLSRVAVVTALTLHQFKSHVKLLEDVGMFFCNLEETLAAASESPREVVFSSNAQDHDASIATYRFVAAVKVVCSRMALGCAAVAEVGDAVAAASTGGGVPAMLGGSVVQAGPLGRNFGDVADETSASMVLSPTQLASQKGRNQGSPRSVHQLMAQLGDPSLTVNGGWSTRVALSLRSGSAPPGAQPQLTSPLHASPTKKRLASRSQTTFSAVATRGGSISDEASPPPAAASALPAPYQRLFTLSEHWGPLLDVVLKHLQLQQHQLQYWFAKVLIENACPSEVQPWLFFVPARVLEAKLPFALMNVDDPIFPDMEALMEYYYRYPMPVVKEEKGLRHRAGAPRRLSALMRSPSEIDGAAWRVLVASLMETIIHACDASPGADHFNIKSPTSSVGRGAKSSGFTDNDSLDGGSGGDSFRSDSVSSPKGSMRMGTQRASKSDTALAAPTAGVPTPPPPPATPLGIYLRHAQREAESLGKHRPHADRYVWKAPSQRPLPSDDMYAVEDVYLHLCGLPLRQYFYQESKW